MSAPIVSEGADLADPTWFARADPHPEFARLRAERPVHRRAYEGGPYWVLTRYADVVAVLQDPEAFSSSYGIHLREVRRDGPDPAADKLLEMCDPPRHRDLRPSIAAGHTRRAMTALQDRVRADAAALVERAAARGRFDGARDIAAPAAAATAFTLLGVPEPDREVLAEGNRRAESMDPELDVRPPFTTPAEQANHDTLRHLLRLIGTRSDELEPGTIRALLDTEVDGHPLSREEIVLNALGLMDAAYGTLRHATTGGMLALVRHPEQLARVRSDPALLPALAEEVVRWVSPVMHLARVATRDATVAGVRIRAGDVVTAWVASANRDEAVFPHADRFDVARTPNRHLGFATGPHTCLAGGLARMHLEIVLGEFVRRLPAPAQAGPVVPVVSNVINGIDRLPLVADGTG